MLGKLLLAAYILIISNGKELTHAASSLHNAETHSYPTSSNSAENKKSGPVPHIDQSEHCEQSCLSECSKEGDSPQDALGCYVRCCDTDSQTLINAAPEEEDLKQCKAQCDEFCINNVYIEDCQVKCLEKLCAEQSLSIDIGEETENVNETWVSLASISIIMLYAAGIVFGILYLHKLRAYFLNCTEREAELRERLISV
jgi:hypothetical protein